MKQKIVISINPEYVKKLFLARKNMNIVQKQLDKILIKSLYMKLHQLRKLLLKQKS